SRDEFVWKGHKALKVRSSTLSSSVGRRFRLHECFFSFILQQLSQL
ncbi:hypothetical protein GE061_004170, partial [Apolygus lucorum]